MCQCDRRAAKCPKCGVEFGYGDRFNWKECDDAKNDGARCVRGMRNFDERLGVNETEQDCNRCINAALAEEMKRAEEARKGPKPPGPPAGAAAAAKKPTGVSKSSRRKLEPR